LNVMQQIPSPKLNELLDMEAYTPFYGTIAQRLDRAL
jgi:hypothetical protein